MRTRPITAAVAALSLGLGALAFAPSGTTAGADLLVPPTATSGGELVADAGASVAIATGQRDTVSGAAYGGTAPYSFSWRADEGTLADPSNPTATLVADDADGDGRSTLTLTVTDARGATASDRVDVVVVGGSSGGGGADTVLLDETVTDTTPGALELTTTDFTFEVPEGIASMQVTIEWTLPTNDYDLRVFDPSGAEAASAGSAPPATTESTGVAAPVAGTWTVSATHYANLVDPALTARVVATQGVTGGGGGDVEQLPTVDAGGPYGFVVGQRQRLDATTTGPVARVGWDTDLDGVVDVTGADPVLDLPVGRHVVVAHVEDGTGLASQQMTSVRVARDRAELAELAVPFTVIGIADSGINPYHAEFSAATYPDPEVLEITRGFTRHPSEYIPGYPQDAQALPITTGQGYYPEQDTHLWTGNTTVQPGQLYWIPGTKIIGAIDAGGSTGVTSGDDTHPILDDNGHGTGSSSVSAGNRYGYCPTCLLVHTEALDETVAAGFDWVDLSSNSFGAVGGVPLGLLNAGGDNADQPTRIAAERGQLTFFSAGNGTGNAFATTPILTHGSDPNGADWVITVGATREDNQGAIVSDGFPVHTSGLGDGDLPSACRTGVTGQCMFGGTSAASPYTAGAFGRILTEVRDVLGDQTAGQRPGQVVAEGRPVPGSPYLADGVLTRAELRAVGLKTAMPRSTYGDAGIPIATDFPFPWTYSGPEYVWFEGYGSSGPAHAARAISVLLGETELPDRTEQDEFFAMDCQVREGLYGGYDRDGDGVEDSCADDELQTLTGAGEATNDDPRLDDFAAGRAAVGGAAPLASERTYFLHRLQVSEPGVEGSNLTTDPAGAGTGSDYTELLEPVNCGEGINEFTMSTQDTEGDLEPCFDTRITTNLAPFRVRLAFPATDQLDGALPAGSRVTGTIFLQTAEPSPTGLTVELKATDRVVGVAEEIINPTLPQTWTPYELDFTTDRAVAPGEQLAINIKLGVARAYAFGFEGDHASFLTVTPAAAPGGDDLAFGVEVPGRLLPRDGGVRVTGRVAVPTLGADPQLAGFHDTSVAVQLSTSRDFRDAVVVDADPATSRFSAFVEARGGQTVYVRPLRDRVPGPVSRVAVGGGGGAGGPSTPGTPGLGLGRFVDDDSSIFESEIEQLAASGITRGCNPPTNDRFCPDALVTRGQVAAFFVRALGLTERDSTDFVDDDDSIFEADIEKLATAGITRGCNPPTNDRFCPEQSVTRGQFAAFMVRAQGLTASDPSIDFVDDDGSVFEADIEKLATAGITRGCNPPTNDRFCPTQALTRGQLAAFFVRAGLTD